MRQHLRHVMTRGLRGAGASVARARVLAALLAAGSLAVALAAACASGGDTASAGDDGGGGDGTLSGDGPFPEGSYSDRGGRDVSTVTCSPSGPATTCASPTNLGSMMPAQTLTSTGNLVPAGQDAYLTVTFNGNTSEDYHPSIALTKGASEFRFDVFSDCNSTTLTCGDQEGGDDDGGGGASTGLTTWRSSTPEATSTRMPPRGRTERSSPSPRSEPWARCSCTCTGSPACP